MPTVGNWKAVYEERLTSAHKALRKIRSGNRVFISPGCGEPQHLLEELVELGRKSAHLNDVEIVHMLTVGAAPHAQKVYSHHFRHNSLFVGPGVREAVAQGLADYTPIFLSEIPGLFKSGRMPLDVALIQVTPPDEFGFCSLGISVEAVKAAVQAANLVIAQVNPQMPRTLGDSFVHVEDMDCFVEFDEPLLEVESAGPPDEIALQIARHATRLVENGATIQVGIGAVPNAILYGLKDKKDLGVHTEMFSDGLIDLIEAGVVNNTKKQFHPGKILATFCIGTRRLYDYVDNNPMFEFHPVDYNSSPINIAKNEKMVAINTALQVDITGQVCADSLGHQIYSGIGGQADFMRGAALSPQGKPIIALPSTAKNGAISRIVPRLSEGAGVVTTRGDVHYIVTEYGVAYLHGKSLRERAVALIQIAHPKFREELLAAAKAMKYIYEDQIMPESIYPVEMEHSATFGNMELFFRPIKASDERLFQEYLYKLSERSVYLRFFQVRRDFPHELAQEMVAVNYQENLGLVATLGNSDTAPIIAAGHWMMDYHENMAEIAFSVIDEHQRKGLGTHILHYMMRIAKERGLQGFHASVIAGNMAMMRVFQKSGCVLHTDYEGGEISLSFRFDDKIEKRSGGHH